MNKKPTPKLKSFVIGIFIVVALAVVIILTLQNKPVQQFSLAEAGPVLEYFESRFPDSDITEQVQDPTTIVLISNPHGLSCTAARAFLEELDYPHIVYQLEEGQYLNDVTLMRSPDCPVDYHALGGLDSYPTLFVKDTAFIGFNKNVAKQIRNMIAE